MRRFYNGLECRTVRNSNKADGRNTGKVLYGWYRNQVADILNEAQRKLKDIWLLETHEED